MRVKHKVLLNDYCDEFGLLRSTPLVDSELSELLRASAKRRLQDPGYKEEATQLCLAMSAANKGRNISGMGPVGKERLAKRNKEANETYLSQLASNPKLTQALRENLLPQVLENLHTSRAVLKKVVGDVTYRTLSQETKSVRVAKTRLTNRRKSAPVVLRVLGLMQTTRTITELCAQAEIGMTTYKRWVKQGVIPAHPHSHTPAKKRGN